MKSFSLIQQQIVFLYQKLETARNDHAKLCQIDMLSSTGNEIREKINTILGEINALEWIINDQINGDL
jgi:hypothetical protein